MLQGEMMIRYKCELEDYLNNKLNKEVGQIGYSGFSIIVLEDYEKFKTEGDRNAYHFYKGSAFQYVQLGAKHALLMSQYDGKPYYHSSIIVRKNGNIKQLRDISSSRYAFTSKYSSSGYLYPRLFLADNNIYLNDLFFNDIRSASQVLKAVAQGRLDAGFVYEGILSRQDLKPFIDSVIEFYKIPHRIPADPLWVDDNFYTNYSSFCNTVASAIIDYQNSKNEAYYTLISSSDKEFNAIRDAYKAIDYVMRFKNSLITSSRIVFVLKNLYYIIYSLIGAVILLVFLTIATLRSRARRLSIQFNISIKEKELLEKSSSSRLIENQKKMARLKNELIAAEELLDEAAQRPNYADTKVNESESLQEDNNLYQEYDPAVIQNQPDAKTLATNSSSKHKTLQKQLSFLEAVLRNYFLENSAKKDLLKINKDKAALTIIQREIVDLDRYYPAIPPGMKMEKYKACKDVCEIRCTGKYRIYLSQGRKSIIRVDISHEHGKIGRWFKTKNCY